MTALAINGPACFVADLGSQNPLDLHKLKAARWNGIACEGVILRATRSTGATDPQFASRFEVASELGFLAGAYAFNTGDSAAIQATLFLNVTRRYGAMLRALDFETNPSGGQMSLVTAIEWLDRVDQATGHRAWLYSGNRIKELIIAATDEQRDFLAQHALWGCEYGPTFKCFDANGKRMPWLAPALWQFTGDGVGSEPHALAGLETGADISVFRGSRADLEKLWCGNAVARAADAPAASVMPPKPTAPKPAPPPAKPPMQHEPKSQQPRPFDWWFRMWGR